MLAKMSRSWLFFFSCLLLLAVSNEQHLDGPEKLICDDGKVGKAPISVISSVNDEPTRTHYSITLMKISETRASGRARKIPSSQISFSGNGLSVLV